MIKDDIYLQLEKIIANWNGIKIFWYTPFKKVETLLAEKKFLIVSQKIITIKIFNVQF